MKTQIIMSILQELIELKRIGTTRMVLNDKWMKLDEIIKIAKSNQMIKLDYGIYETS
jgi:hypothetical protein